MVSDTILQQKRPKVLDKWLILEWRHRISKINLEHVVQLETEELNKTQNKEIPKRHRNQLKELTMTKDGNNLSHKINNVVLTSTTEYKIKCVLDANK